MHGNNPPVVPPAALTESSGASMTESQPPTLRDFPEPPSRDNLRDATVAGPAVPKKSSKRHSRLGRPPRVVAWKDSNKRDPSVTEKYTFYREGTPPPIERAPEPVVPSASEPYDYKYDYVAPPAPIPEPTLCGVRKRTFWLILAAVLVLIALAVGIGVGVGVGTNQGSSSSEQDAQISPTTTPVTTDTTQPTRTTTEPPESETASPTKSSESSESSTASTISANPAITTLTSCPAANDTIYDIPGTDQRFLRICGVDYTGAGAATDLAHAWTPTMEDCMIHCAGFPGCEGAGWGIIRGDPGSYHRCWLKGDIKDASTVRMGWDFAILQ